ncbi:T9SS type B sorting domain-containing protein [Flavobacterium sp. Arc2]|jgi:gliding motility-associated-like protein|uniref:T9SS type B sorting domain-containing protein n=1 Tax=Flavobacterium sp. Arc2 TaxID=3046685 RepID=UPI00352E4765
MKKKFRSLAYLLLIAFLFHNAIFANTRNETLRLESNISLNNKGKDSLMLFSADKSATGNMNFAPLAPTVTSLVYLCQNSTATALTATASTGATLIWYGTDVTGGTGSSIAPTPSTTNPGQTTYYVSQSDGTVESPKAEIVVNVVADTYDTIQFINCTYPSPNSIYFDWANILYHPSNAYNYSYSIAGGPLFIGNANNSSLTVPGVLPGQSVTVTITSVVGFPCIPPASKTCSVACGSSTITPTFTLIPTSYCINETTINLSTSSEDSPAIPGTWSPAKVNTATAGTTNYVFTPNPGLFPCAKTKTLAVTVGPVDPNFTDFSICSGEVPPSLNTMSPNGIVGTWAPSSIDNVNSGAYYFTPNPGQACAPTAKIINVTVNPSNAILSLGWTVTDAFSDDQIVTITDPLGANYLYQMDDGPLQEEAIFKMVSVGTHAITVKDVNGCSEYRNDNILVIGYPKFFTPNADGYNDRWNIFELQADVASRIRIFDRYGKLLKEIRPNGIGWDGTYNGRPMPGNDYWFVVEYTEDNISKEFKSHFSLKR